MKTKPDYWGNFLYESAMGLYDNEKEAKEESWMGENSFPLYSEATVKALEEKLAQYEKAEELLKFAIDLNLKNFG